MPLRGRGQVVVKRQCTSDRASVKLLLGGHFDPAVRSNAATPNSCAQYTTPVHIYIYNTVHTLFSTKVRGYRGVGTLTLVFECSKYCHA
jgi:hypothetical protein